MENKQYPTLKQRLEDIFAVKTYPYKSLTKTARNIQEIKESFVLPNIEVISAGILGQIKQQYLSQGYKLGEKTENGILWFSKGKNLLAANISYSTSGIMVDILDLPMPEK